jgi:beta-glucosidase-like glycosyl hydrolase/CubicO group peptidase (beta-lactamase class C family)
MTKTKKIAFLPLLGIVICSWLQLAPIALTSSGDAVYLGNQKQWVENTLSTMTTDQKLGQLFVIAAYSNRTESSYQEVERLIRNYHVGGILFFQGTPVQQAILTNRYQNVSKVPLLITIDAEWGLGMRLQNTVSFPKNITLGAIQDDYLVETMGEEIGRQCKRLGIHINYAPVADINTNPNNPVINYRSFGESKFNVATKAAAYARGMQRQNVLASAKHFPGHGDTGQDSHFSMPVINKTKQQLTETELFPFQYLISDSIASVLTGHLYIPSLDNGENRSATVSKRIVTDLLKGEMGFQGLAITDALVMQGLTKYYGSGNAELEAFKAGNDLLLQPKSIATAFTRMKSALANGEITITDLDERVRNILRAKYWAGLNRDQQVSLINLQDDLNNSTAQQIKVDLFDNAVTIVKNKQDLLPFIHLDTSRFASLSISPGRDSGFIKSLDQYADFKHFTIPFKPSKTADWSSIVAQAAKYDVVVVGVHDTNSRRSRNYGMTPATERLISKLQQSTKVIVCVFGNPYGLRNFNESDYLVCGYEDVPEAHQSVAQILFGALPARGTLPVTVNKAMKLGDGVFTQNLGRLHYENPAKVGMNINVLKNINAIAEEGIQQGAYPGCQVLVARKGAVVYHKAYGNLRYGVNEPVTNETIYDLASVTKVSATLQAIMFLNERGEIDLNQTASHYLPELKGTNKANMLIGEILMHQAGLKSFIPFWVNTKSSDGSFDRKYYTFRPDYTYLQVADNLYIKPEIRDDVWQWLIESPLSTRRSRQGGFRYLYSDLGLIMLQRIVEKTTNMPLNEFAAQHFYEPLGMVTTTFNPLEKFPKERIAPTEYDKVFRGKPIQGTVHDPNAALLGGVAGHAGLFSNAWDLAKLFQMNLQRGFYSERHYLFPETVSHFATNYSTKSHRGLGWNKPTGRQQSSVAIMASSATYGHTGFTGTVVWVDPTQDLIFIMLSNRVYPTVNNKKLGQLKIRRRMHEAVYNSIIYS